ncbi:MAG: hypothetical protein ISR69_00625 [Gammaproteobacteria bacterium]|nr:hypothetical protein [Gammaproteobacteria bacterium]
MKPFILMTTGRTGSTSLIDALAAYDDIAVPNKQIDCVDNEIMHPNFFKKYLPFYQKYSKTPINNEVQLINAFFLANQNSPFAGFKSMPERHQQLQALINTPSIQIITLIRNDIASTIASFIIAIDKSTWRRYGEKQNYSFTFDDSYKPRILGHLKYILNSQLQLNAFPNAINLIYEDLCDPSYENPQLDTFFERKIKLQSPKKPTKARHYVNNWDEYFDFVNQSISSYNIKAPS